MGFWLVGALLILLAVWPVLSRRRERRRLLRQVAPSPTPSPPGPLLDVMAVKGFSYVPNREELLPLLRNGEPLVLRREPQNPHDCNAIRLLRADGKPIGYLPRRYNAIPAALLDEGVGILGRLQLEGGEGRYARMQAELYWEEQP